MMFRFVFWKGATHDFGLVGVEGALETIFAHSDTGASD